VNWQIKNAHQRPVFDAQQHTQRELIGVNIRQSLARSFCAENFHGNQAAQQVVRTAEHPVAAGSLQMIIRLENCRGGKRAFSLVEVIVATFVVAILFTALFIGLSQGFAVSTAATERLRANQIVLERIEGFRLVRWSDLNNTALVPTSFTNYYNPSAPAGQSKGASYIGRVTIATPSLGTSYNDKMKKITVTVTWVTGTITRTETVSTFVSQNGLQNYVYYN
jgi:prepilin-type N-terminal cleavage/methylation domain-containing protein